MRRLMSLLTRMVGVFRLRLLDGRGERRECGCPRVLPLKWASPSPLAVFLENDLQFAAVGQFHALAQTALAAEAVEHPRNRAGVLAQLGGFALEPVNFLDDLNGNEDGVFLETEQRIGIVEENVGIKDVIFHKTQKLKLNRANTSRLMQKRCEIFHVTFSTGPAGDANP